MAGSVSRVTQALQRRLTDFYWERRFGVFTEATAPPPGPDSRVYVTMPYSAIFQVLARLHLGRSDVLVEIGCGKGRVLLAATRYPISEIVGIELSGVLAAQALGNLQKQRNLLPKVEVLAMAGQDFDFRRGTVYYLYNPFGPDSFRAMLSGLEEGLLAVPRPVRIVYARPCHEDVFHEFGWLEKAESFEVQGWAGEYQTVSIWRNADLNGAKPSHA